MNGFPVQTYGRPSECHISRGVNQKSGSTLILHAHIKIIVTSCSQSPIITLFKSFFFSRDDHTKQKICGEKCAKYRYTVVGPIFTYLVRVVKIDDLYPRYAWATNIANEWLPIQTYERYKCCIISTLKVKIKNPAPSIF